MASCGAKAPCCHVGYPHRHCEHCDVVIATGYYAPYYAPYVPYQPYWRYNTWGVTQTGTGATLQQALSQSALGQSALGQSAPGQSAPGAAQSANPPQAHTHVVN